MSEPVDTNVVIIGAGSTGLALAQGLKAAGISSRIFERHDRDHLSREWSMSLHWGGEFLEKVLPPSPRERLGEINTDPYYDFSKDEGFIQCNGETGEVILVMQGKMPRRISRRKLRTLLSEGLDVEYNLSLETMTLTEENSGSPFVQATFSDQSTVTCRVLVGCDGSRSRVRQLLVSNETLSTQTPTPYTILNFPYTYPAELVPELRVIHPVFKVAYHPKLNCMYMLATLDASQAKTTGEVTFQNLISWRGPPTASDIKADPSLALKHFWKLGSQFAPPFCTAAINVAGDAKVFADQGMQWDPRKLHSVASSDSPERTTCWDGHSWSGRVTLAGDAGHARLPHRGQGLNNSLEDAARLAAALTAVFKEETKSLEEAITAYELEMVERGGEEVETSAKAAVAAHDWNILTSGPMFKHGANKVR